MNPNNKHILLAEDSPTQAQQTRHVLESEGYQVETARNGREALDLALKTKPSLVISDVMMPEMDGYELCRQIRASAVLSQVPIILLTSLSDPEDIIKGLACGADNFVTKPFNPEYLLNRIHFIFTNQKFRSDERATIGVEIVFAGRKHFITSDKLQILNLLFSTYETAVQKNKELIRAQAELRALAEDLENRVQQRTAALTREIAERKEAEERVREQAALLDKASDAIFVTDLDGRVTQWYQGAQGVYGWTEAEAVGKTAGALLQNVFSQPENLMKETLQTGEWLGELSHRTKDGETVFVQSRWTLLRDENGKPKSVLVINTDITEKKQSEAKFLRVQRMENIGALAGGIAHDLNNSLAPILMASDMLREELTTEEGLKMLETMRNSAHRGADMVKQILSFSRGVSGDHVVLQLKHLISDMEKFARSTFPRSIQVRMKIPRDLFPILGDATQLHQVLLNLYVNARDAMPVGGTLQVEAANIHIDESHPNRQVTGPHIALTVSDTGHGMPPEVLDKIFEPFFTTKELGKGTGLGLSTVMGIVKTHRGFVTVSSEVGRGTSFRVFLPAADSKASAPAQKRQPPPSGSGELILVVDDEKAILEMTKLMLEAYNYRVLTAFDGVEAIDLFTKNRDEIKAVVTDMMMPNLNGPQLVRKLQELAPDLKVIGVSGLGSEASLNKAGKEFVKSFLRKPFSPESLLVKLREILSARGN